MFCAEEKLIETEDIEMKCRIFQGDSLSPPLFCISVILLTEQLNRLNTGYEEHTTKTKISLLFDLKLIGKTEEELQKLMQTDHSLTISLWSSDLMSVRRLYSRKEIYFTHKIYNLTSTEKFKSLNRENPTKYLGTEESEGINK
jgi:hypothetical protein